MKALLTRHPEPDIPKGICYGISDVPAHPHALDPARFENVDTCFTSPLSRCRDVAIELFGKRHIVDERLREIDFGDWELRPWDDIPREQIEEWNDNLEDYVLPGGESYSQFRARALSFWHELAHHRAERVAIFTHSGVIRVILAAARNLHVRDSLALEVPYNSIHEVSLS